MITIDGSFGEGGGQVLRTSLALSLVTGQPFRITNIRAGRRKPGLLRQHLTAVNAAAAVSSASVDGNEMKSRGLTFRPKRAKAGEYRFAVGTAGSATLVLQTVLPALLLADGPSRLTLEGGTHNPYAPPFDFLTRSFLPIVNRMGPTVTATLDRPGFYPAGGGCFTVDIAPAGGLAPIELLERGELVRHEAVAIVSQLPRSIAEKELATLGRLLPIVDGATRIEQVTAPRGPGNVVMVILESEHVSGVFTGFGERGVPSERVARSVVKPVREYLTSDVPVGRYLADQLLVPMAVAGEGEFTTLPLTRHSATNVEVLKQFLDVGVTVTKPDRLKWHVRVS